MIRGHAEAPGSFIIRNLLRTSGMSRERYFELLAQV